jgi:hypothetical protein
MEVSMKHRILLQRTCLIAVTFIFINTAVKHAQSKTSSLISKNVHTSVNAFNDFMRSRSGITLSAPAKAKLAQLEESTINGSSRRLRADELVDILTDVSLERLLVLNDDEIERVARTFHFDGSYAGFTWGALSTTPQQFISDVKALRKRCQQDEIASRKLLRSVIAGRSPEAGVHGHLNLYSKVWAEQFGSALQQGLTPLQSTLLVYAIVTDDPIHWSEDGIRNEMQHAHETMADDYPDPQGRVPYGPHGFLFPTPADVLLNDHTVLAILERIEKQTKSSG